MDNTYMQHVLDLEEWNEEERFVWLPPTVVFGPNEVTVVHPFTHPTGINGGGEAPCTVIAVYTPLGEKLALWVVDLTGVSKKFLDHNYWGK